MAVPVSVGFPNWRLVQADDLRKTKEWIVSGVLFSVERNGFWWPAWGKLPHNLSDALSVGRSAMITAPPLIPILAHRFMPTDPCEAGNPVFSVMGTDITYYGNDLGRYFAHEFGGLPYERAVSGKPKRVPYWSDFHDWINGGYRRADG